MLWSLTGAWNLIGIDIYNALNKTSTNIDVVSSLLLENLDKDVKFDWTWNLVGLDILFALNMTSTSFDVILRL